MIRCRNCGGEVEEGRGFCPHCGKPVAAPGERLMPEAAPRALPTMPAPHSGPVPTQFAPESGAVPMESFGKRGEERDNSRLVIYGAVALVALLLIGGLAYLASRPSAKPGEEKLAGAIRPGEAGFPGDKLVVDFDPDENATIGANALGNYVVTMKPTVRNFTGRVVNGLEFHAAGLDIHGQTISESTYVREVEIEPNRTASPPMGLNFPPDNRPAQLKLELTGVRFK